MAAPGIAWGFRDAWGEYRVGIPSDAAVPGPRLVLAFPSGAAPAGLYDFRSGVLLKVVSSIWPTPRDRIEDLRRAPEVTDALVRLAAAPTVNVIPEVHRLCLTIPAG